MAWNKIEKTYHVTEKNFCVEHNCKMTQVPCSMYVYCEKCHQERLKNITKGVIMTKAQKWARERNGVKFILGGIVKNLKIQSFKSCLLTTEKAELRRAVLFLNETIASWKPRNELSKKKFMEGK